MLQTTTPLKSITTQSANGPNMKKRKNSKKQEPKQPPQEQSPSEDNTKIYNFCPVDDSLVLDDECVDLLMQRMVDVQKDIDEQLGAIKH